MTWKTKLLQLVEGAVELKILCRHPAFVPPSCLCWPSSGSSENLWGNVRPSPKLEKTGRNILHQVSPKTSAKFPLFPRLKPSLSGPRLNTGALNSSSVVLLLRTRWMWYPSREQSEMLNMAETKKRNRMWNFPWPENWIHTLNWLF